VCGCGGSHTRSAACQELAKTGANRVDRATQAGHADFADLDVLDAVEHWFTLSCSLGGGGCPPTAGLGLGARSLLAVQLAAQCDRPGPVTDSGQTATYWKILATLLPCSSEPMRQRPAV
jgi:hypothetical protein